MPEISESVRVTADIPKDLHKRLKIVLVQEERTIQAVIERGLDQYARFPEAQAKL
jgi:hypothetical protein